MLSTKLTKSILHTTDNYIKALEKAGILTVGDLLNQFPRDYEDRTDVLDSFSLINVKDKNTILVKLLSLNNQKTANNKLLTKAVLEDKNGFLSEAVWFNRKYLGTQLKNSEWKKVIVSGKVKYAFWKVTFQSPDIETDLSKVGGEIVPIYSDLNYIPTKWTSGKIELLKKYIGDIDEVLPLEIMEKYGFIPRKEAYYRVHFPKNKNDIEIARYRLAYEELFEINYRAISAKYKSFEKSEGKSIAIPLNADLIKDIISNIPFDLTDHQKIVLFQALKDMEKNHGMQRLLEWDVWTWKTVVALIASIHAILESRKQPSPPAPLPKREGSIEYSQKVYNPKHIVELSKKLRKDSTEAEDILWELLRNRQFNDLKFRRQHPFWRYIADFYCDDLKLVIELDGKIHESNDKKEYDGIRDEIIEAYWVNVLRFKNEDIYENIDNIFQSIISYIPSPIGRALGWGLWVWDDELGWGLCSKKWGQGLQVAIMAPTEILARQHFASIQDLLMKYNISSHLLVWSTTAKQKHAVKTDIKNGNIDVVVGTHALVQDDVIFHNLWLVIIDEQHRFGVKQREVLESGLWNRSWVIPHSLNMTATPIPRTLALTLYGDQDLSIISEYPKWRKDIFTKVSKTDNNRYDIELFVRSELEKGRQVFWISPLVEESEKIDLANAVNTYESLVDIFSPFQVWLLHGKMKPKEKEQIMQDFKDNKIQVLSSTSVVEVWVDVPNATIMCIEWAERFGLSQLHQFRWRVWRWQYQSYCYLFPSKWNYTDRLKAMERTNNGFELAEIDLEIRWPWEVYGLRQSGVPDLKVASLTDLELISQIREDIEKMFETKK